MAGIFIVGLPCGNMRVAAITFGHGGDDPRTVSAIAHVREIIVAARAETTGPPLRIHRQHVGVAVQHPACRGGGGRAQHHLQPMAAQRVNRAVQPFPVIGGGGGFHPCPSEFANTHPCQAKGRHAGGILVPLRLGPMFGVVADAQRAFHGIT